jgi:hypothetical protein
MGALLIGVASFLPWIQRTAAAVGRKPATTSNRTAAQDLIRVIHETMQAPDSVATYSTAINDGMAAFALWGVPFLLILLGLSVLMTRSWAPRLGTRFFFALLVAGNVAFTILLVWLYTTIHVDVGTVTYTRQIGPAVALLGDLLALVGILWLARLPSIPRAPGKPTTPTRSNVREYTDQVPIAPPPLTPPPLSKPPQVLLPVEDW